MKFLVPALLFLSLPLFAATATVDCTGATPGAFTSINAALATLDPLGPHTVNVSGTCVENVVILHHDRVTLQGSPAATIQTAANIALRVDRSRGVTLRRLTVTGGNTGVAIQRNSDAILEAVTIENAANGLTVFDGSIANLGGSNAATQFVLIQNNGNGALLDEATVILGGNVTISANTLAGIDAESTRLAFIGNSAPNDVSNNGGNGVFAHGTSDVDFRGVNTVNGNTLNGIFAFESSSIDILGNPSQFTTVSGNLRGGVVFLFNSSGRVQNTVITNNGTVGNPISSGVTVANNASAIINVSTITGSNGPGVIVDSGSMARIFGSTISGGTAEPIRLLTGGILELTTGNTISAPTRPLVVCDDSAVLFGDGANISTSCKKTK